MLRPFFGEKGSAKLPILILRNRLGKVPLVPLILAKFCLKNLLIPLVLLKKSDCVSAKFRSFLPKSFCKTYFS